MKIAPAVAAEYARSRNLSVAAASEELLRVLAGREPHVLPSGNLKLRYRSNADRLDVSAIVDAATDTIIGVTVRGYHSRSGGEKKRSR